MCRDKEIREVVRGKSVKEEPVFNVFNAKDFKSAALVPALVAEMNLVLFHGAVSNDYFIIDQYFFKGCLQNNWICSERHRIFII